MLPQKADVALGVKLGQSNDFGTTGQARGHDGHHPVYVEEGQESHHDLLVTSCQTGQVRLAQAAKVVSEQVKNGRGSGGVTRKGHIVSSSPSLVR